MTEGWLDGVSDEVVRQAVQTGFAYQVFWNCPIEKHLWWIVPTLVMPAIAVRQTAFGFSGVGIPKAFMTWAYLSDEVTQDLAAKNDRPLRIDEWNEGTNLWIMTLLAQPGYSLPFLRAALPKIPHSGVIRAVRRGPNWSAERIVTCRLSHCWSASSQHEMRVLLP